MEAIVNLFVRHGFTFECKGYSVAVINDPPGMFQEEDSRKVVESLRIVAAESFGVPVERQSIDGVRDHVTNVDVLAVMYDAEKVFGFASARIIPEHDLFFLHGAAVLRATQGKGVGLSVVKILLEKSKMQRIAFTTQNPAMFCLCRKVFGLVYPRPEIIAISLILPRTWKTIFASWICLQLPFLPIQSAQVPTQIQKQFLRKFINTISRLKLIG